MGRCTREPTLSKMSLPQLLRGIHSRMKFVPLGTNAFIFETEEMVEKRSKRQRRKLVKMKKTQE